MPKIKGLLTMNESIIDFIGSLNIEENIQNIIDENKKEIKKEFYNYLIEEKLKLLMKISEGENLDFEELKNKYMKDKELISLKEISNKDENTESYTILKKVILNNNEFYYEQKENGKIYDKNSTHVGYYKNDNFHFEI